MKFNTYLKKLPTAPSFTSILVFVVLIIVNAILQPGFFSSGAVSANFMTFTPLILISMAQTIIVISGSIDLSIGTSITLCNVVMVSFMKDGTGNMILAALAAFAVALIIALVNGFITGVIKLPPMVATFATSAVWYGTSLLIMPTPGGYVPEPFYKLYRESLFDTFPAGIVLLIIAILVWVFIRTRRLYRNLYATGGNEECAKANGINTWKTKMAAYLIASIFVWLASVAVTAQTASGDAHVGDSFALNSIAAIVIGGIALSGGKGNILGTILGACSMGLLMNIIFFANIPSLYQEFIKGLIIITALVLAVIPSLRKKSTGIIVEQK